MIICGYIKINDIVSLIFLFIGLNLLIAEENIISNQIIIENELKSTLDSTIGSTFLKGEDLIIKYNHLSDEKIAFLKTLFIKHFTSKGLIVRRDSAKYKIEIEQFETNIVYKNITGSVWGVGDMAERNVSIKLDGWIEKYINNMYVPFRVDRRIIDEIKFSNIQGIEKSPYSFTTGRMLKKTSWISYIEPIVVSISAATVIILFFVLRT